VKERRRVRRPIVLAGLLALWQAPGAPAYHLDSSNTRISFEIERLGLRWFSVDFHDLTGDFALGPDGQGASLTVVVRTDSIDARSPYWNERLRSAQWLDTERFPEMIFRSTGFSFDGAAHATLQGELTLHGVTRQLALSIPPGLSLRGPGDPATLGIRHSTWVLAGRGPRADHRPRPVISSGRPPGY
jgi:polyisoprenoid-binding protein YceI